MSKAIPTRADVADCHSIATKLAGLQEQYLWMSTEFRESLEEELDFSHTLYKLILMADKMVAIAEERKPERAPMSDCFSTAPPSYTEEDVSRYSKALHKAARGNLQNLLNLPEQDKELLKTTRDLHKKTLILEDIARRNH